MSSCRAVVVSRPKNCQNCDAEFSCGLSCCWCDEVKLDASTVTAMQARFSDCLCPACLQLAASGQLAAPDQRRGE